LAETDVAVDIAANSDVVDFVADSLLFSVEFSFFVTSIFVLMLMLTLGELLAEFNSDPDSVVMLVCSFAFFDEVSVVGEEFIILNDAR